jgi:hypothetical protein
MHFIVYKRVTMVVTDRKMQHNGQHLNKLTDFIDIRAYQLFIQVYNCCDGQIYVAKTYRTGYKPYEQRNKQVWQNLLRKCMAQNGCLTNDDGSYFKVI